MATSRLAPFLTIVATAAIPTILAIALSPSRATAQAPSVVDPPMFEYVSGTRMTGYPFGYAHRKSVRYLEIRDGLASAARTIRGVGWRRTTGGTTRVPAFDVTCTIRLSTAPHAAASISNHFGQNIGGDATAILGNRSVAFAATEPQTVLPGFEYRFPATQPFVFGGLGSLCLDIEVHDHTNRKDFTLDLFRQGRPHSGSFGAACGGTDLSTTLTTNDVRHDSSGFPGFAPVLFLAGVPLATPLDLSSIGAPGCTNLVSNSVTLGGQADSSGHHSITFPTTQAQPGDAYACQTVAILDGLNQLGAVFTQGAFVMPLSPAGTGRVFADSAAATTGTAQSVFGLVLAIY